jgi:hypothetical protein
MCRKDVNSIITERTTLVGIDRYIARLSHELLCLISPGALIAEENVALTAFLGDLRGLLVSTRHPVAPPSADLGCVCPCLSCAA